MTLVDVEGEDKGVLKGFMRGGETTSFLQLSDCWVFTADFYQI